MTLEKAPKTYAGLNLRFMYSNCIFPFIWITQFYNKLNVMHIRQSHINERGKNSVKVLINEMYCKYTKTNININLLQLNKAWAAIKAYLNHV